LLHGNTASLRLFPYNLRAIRDSALRIMRETNDADAMTKAIAQLFKNLTHNTTGIKKKTEWPAIECVVRRACAPYPSRRNTKLRTVMRRTISACATRANMFFVLGCFHLSSIALCERPREGPSASDRQAWCFLVNHYSSMVAPHFTALHKHGDITKSPPVTHKILLNFCATPPPSPALSPALRRGPTPVSPFPSPQSRSLYSRHKITSAPFPVALQPS
jgi:hypothetical protein